MTEMDIRCRLVDWTYLYALEARGGWPDFNTISSHLIRLAVDRAPTQEDADRFRTGAALRLFATPPAAAQSNGDAGECTSLACERDIKALMDQCGDQFSEIELLRAQLQATRKALEEILRCPTIHETWRKPALAALTALEGPQP